MNLVDHREQDLTEIIVIAQKELISVQVHIPAHTGVNTACPNTHRREISTVEDTDSHILERNPAEILVCPLGHQTVPDISEFNPNPIRKMICQFSTQ